MNYNIGVDLGGTNIAVAIVDENYNIIEKHSVPTNCPRKAELIVEDIINTIKFVLSKQNISLSQVNSIGIGTPGSVNSQSGIIERAYNLGFVNTPLREMIFNKLNIPCYIENDANAAAYGEFVAGNAKNSDNAVCITIGTGIGGGIIINKKIYNGSNFYGAELGHVVIEYNGKECNCGRKGCMEVYCSATALIEQTKQAMQDNKDTLLWELCDNNISNVNGKTAFDAMKKGDITAEKVIRQYIDYLACGCTNFINIFQPDVLLIGGGISKEGDNLLNPLRKIITKESFDVNSYKPTKVLAASLGNDAGIIGAASLYKLYID